MKRPPWTIRKRIVYATLAFCAFCILWVLIGDDERSVLEVIVISAFGLAGSTIGAFVFAAVWDDRNVMREMGPKAYEEEPPPYVQRDQL